MTPNLNLRRRLEGALLALALLAAACGGASAPTAAAPSPGDGGGPSATTPPSVAEPTPVPGTTGDPGSGTGGGQGGGSEPGNPGTGGPIVDPGPDGNLPANPDPTIVTPTAGLTGVHDVPAANLEAAVNGRNVAARVAWWSGVEPCTALAGITVTRDGSTFLLTIREGSAAAPDQMCIEIAVYKGAVVDLGELEPGTYTITAYGDAAPVEVTVAG
jgi:hypothetical protein